MSKEFTIELGGRTRRIAFRGSDAVALKNRFNKNILRLLREDVMGMRELPNPEKPGQTSLEFTGEVDLEVQVAFITAGIRRGLLLENDPRARTIDEERVQSWVDEHLSKGSSMGPLVEPVYKAFFLSGALGYSHDVDAAAETVKDEEPGDEGKGRDALDEPTLPPSVPAAE